MSEPIAREQADFALGCMGYEVIAESCGVVAYLDLDYLGDPLRCMLCDFSDGPIPWDDFRHHLEYEGVSIAVFLSHLADE